MISQRKRRASMSVENAADQEVNAQNASPVKTEKASKARLDWIDAIALDKRVSAHAFRLAHVLQSRFYNEKTGYAWPAQKTLAKLLDTNERQARYWISELAKAGLLDVKRGGNGQSNRYRLTGSPTAGQGTEQTGSENQSDRQSDYSQTGSPTAADSRLDLADEPGGGAKPSPGSALRSRVSKRSTMKVGAEGDARPPVASPHNPGKTTAQKRPCWKGQEVDIEKLGACVIVGIYPDERRVCVKVQRTGHLVRIGVRPDVQFVASPDDFDEVAQEDRDEETPF
ncbi:MULTISPECIES: helix-turn-helix domain-containing protein [unclassified Mesorhizobium]|uniref:helix-turn-helix domain-containing protein n=1 Tax=unclassified Mesorhizobium TaxID=325217 RepID=UPI001FEF342C|nr:MULTISPECIES: helix-turn-helix domain-containing protein [unclassified Mesorhizobium]